MAVITRYIVVRNGVELDQVFEDKKEAEAYDSMLDAAEQLTLLIEQGNLPIETNRPAIEAIAVCLAQNSSEVLRILKGVKTLKPVGEKTKKQKPSLGEPTEAAKGESRTRAKTRPS